MSRASSTPRAAARRFPRRGALTAALSVGLLVSVLGLASADPRVPYKDPNAIGLITLCDQGGNPVTTGSVTAAPFVWSAHTDVAAPQGYGVDGRTAVLAGYQPRQGVDPGEWSGKFVSTVARYTDAAHPTVQSATSDVALRDLVVSYPPQWDHLLQLRVYLGAPGLSTYIDQYAALDLRISDDGRTWTALERGTASCTVGSAVSAATLLHLTPPSGKALIVIGSAEAPGHVVRSGSAPATAGGSGVVAAAIATSVPAAPGTSAPAGTSTAPVPAQLASGRGTRDVTVPSGGRGGAIAAAFVLLVLVAGGWGGVSVRARDRRSPVHQNLHRELESR